MPWQCATEVDSRDFVLWVKRSEKFVGNKHPTAARGGWNPVTGKRYQSGSYSASTINHTLTCVREFYAFQLERGAGPIVNPIPTAAGDRRHAHHHPERDFVRLRRDPLRQKQPTRTPRAIPDQKFDDLFRKLSCNRDRALVAMYVSSGVRASELLGLTGDRVNYGDQLLGVIRKGGRLEWVPASPDAFVWLRLYEMERGTARSGQAVWLTRREPFQRLSYDAFRAVLGRVNRSLGANWTTHDLRHTFAIRALEGGVPIHEVQALLGHASLDSTNIYTTPRLEDIVEHHRAVFTRKPAGEPAPEQTPYDSSELSTIFGVDP